MSITEKDLVLGLDIGTSSLKLVILNLNTSIIELECNRPTQSAKINSENKLFNEQNVGVLVNLVNDLISEVPSHLLKRVKSFQLCGQVS